MNAKVKVKMKVKLKVKLKVKMKVKVKVKMKMKVKVTVKVKVRFGLEKSQRESRVRTQVCRSRGGHLTANRLAGLVVEASTSGAEDPRFKSRLRRVFFPRSSHTRLI